MKVFRTCSFSSAQTHNCIHISLKRQLHVLIVNYTASVHLVAFPSCLLNLELNYKGKRTWQRCKWFLEWSEESYSQVLWWLWKKQVLCSWLYGISLDSSTEIHFSISRTVSLEITGNSKPGFMIPHHWWGKMQTKHQTSVFVLDNAHYFHSFYT